MNYIQKIEAIQNVLKFIISGNNSKMVILQVNMWDLTIIEEFLLLKIIFQI